MSLKSLTALALILTPANPVLAQAGPDNPAYVERVIAAAEARSDIALMRRALETVHPGLYRYTPKHKIDAGFARLEAAAKGPISELALHREIALMLASIHCDHSKPEQSDALTAFRRKNPTHLPLRFRMVEGRMIVISNDGQPGAPPAGAEIVAINAMPVPALLTKLGALVAYDGSADQAIAAKLGDDSDLMGDDFNEYYPSLFGFPQRWALGWKLRGDTVITQTSLTPISFERWINLDTPDGDYRDEFYKGVTWRLAGKVARLKIDTFVNYRNPVQPTAFLGGFFKAMKAAGTEHLILDLRNNGGGSEDVSIALGRYLVAEPFTWSKPVRYKAVRYGDLPDHIESWGDRTALFTPPLTDFTKTKDGWFERIPDATKPSGSDDDSDIAQGPVTEGHFKGKLTILTGPRNGSGATRTIAQLKQRAGAVLIGEESAGSAEGPTAGHIFLLTLPNSRIKLRIPNAWNRTNIDHWVPNRGVPVDRLVVPTLADYDAGRDRAVEVARLSPVPVGDPAALLAKAVSGRWTGTLEYRDYTTDKRAILPTTLEATGLEFAWIYDDGPGKIIRSLQSWAIDGVGSTLTSTATDGVQQFVIAEWHVSPDAKSITLVLDGSETENEVLVNTRTILTQSGAMLRITKMTKKPGEAFLMRHAYELHR